MYVRPRIRKTQLKNVLWCCWIYAPMSAFFKAGESLTPSPVTATMAPCRWQPSTMISFCCGEVLANTISVWFFRISSSCSLEISWEDNYYRHHHTFNYYNMECDADLLRKKWQKRYCITHAFKSRYVSKKLINLVLKFSLILQIEVRKNTDNTAKQF